MCMGRIECIYYFLSPHYDLLEVNVVLRSGRIVFERTLLQSFIYIYTKSIFWRSGPNSEVDMRYG